MPTRPGFLLHPGAAGDIEDILDFRARDNPHAARRVRKDMLDAIRKLVVFPEMGHRRPDLTTRPLRFQTVRNYLVAYASEEKPLLVLGVLDGRRNPRVLAALLGRRR